MHELDDEVGDLAASIRDLENKLVRDLTEEILKEEVRLSKPLLGRRSCHVTSIIMLERHLS